LVAAGLSACGGEEGNASASTGDGGTTKLTLGIPPVGDSLPVYQAIEKGYFEEEGLEIELVPAANGATTINALVSQSTDLALVSYPSLISAYGSGLPVTVAATAISGTDDYKAGLYVLADSDIKEPADMVGKTMATPSLGSVGDIWFRGVLMDEGLDPEAVKYVEIPQANMATALKGGDVDGAFMTEPTLSAASKELDIRAVGYQNGPQGLFATSKETLEENPGAIEGFRAALAKAVADVDADPHGVAEAAMPAYTDMDPQTAAKMNLPDYITEWDGEGVQQVIDLMVEVGLLEEGFDADELYKEL
jgi:NitT/TauT family transport system substrate-binding protein